MLSLPAKLFNSKTRAALQIFNIRLAISFRQSNSYSTRLGRIEIDDCNL